MSNGILLVIALILAVCGLCAVSIYGMKALRELQMEMLRCVLFPQGQFGNQSATHEQEMVGEEPEEAGRIIIDNSEPNQEE
jgi:hypothetical protein